MPKRGERMPAEQRAKLRATAKARAEEKKAEKETATANNEPTLESVGGVGVELATPQEPAPRSLLDTLKSKMKPAGGAPATKATTKGAEEDNFILTLVPMVSGFLAYYSGSLWAEEYRSCAPSKGEVSAVLTPVSRMIARRLEINLAETPDIRDMRLAGTALMVYILRAATTSIEINAKLEGERAIHYAEKHTSQSRHPNGGATPGAGHPGAGAYQEQSIGTPGYGGGTNGGELQLRSEQSGTAQNGSETDAEYARRTIREAYAQDREYRAQYGLL